MSVKVSIIVPCYGVEKYLDRCMDTLVNQTLKDIEIILVDDGSPDRVPIMCDEWSRKDDRIKVIHKVNGGLGYARNSGLEIATGEYVAFVDSDDYVNYAMYETMFTEAEQGIYDAVFCGFSIEGQPGIWHNSNEVQNISCYHGNNVRFFLLDMIACASGVATERKFQMSVWHAIYKRSIITDYKVYFPSERIYGSEDLPFQVDFLKECRSIKYIPNCFYNYCLNGTSLTATYNTQRFHKYKQLRQLLISKFEQDDIEARQRIDRFFIGYSRSTCNHLVQSSRTEKYSVLKQLINDPIWYTLSHSYSPNNLKSYAKLYYQLILQKRVVALVLLIKTITWIKSVQGKHS